MNEKIYKYDFHDKTGMLNKLRDYVKNPDDDNIRIKNKIKKTDELKIIFLPQQDFFRDLPKKELPVLFFYMTEQGIL